MKIYIKTNKIKSRLTVTAIKPVVTIKIQKKYIKMKRIKDDSIIRNIIAFDAYDMMGQHNYKGLKNESNKQIKNRKG